MLVSFSRDQPWPPDELIIPAPLIEGPQDEDDSIRAEDVVFDKATRAEELETEKH